VNFKSSSPLVCAGKQHSLPDLRAFRQQNGAQTKQQWTAPGALPVEPMLQLNEDCERESDFKLNLHACGIRALNNLLMA